MDTIIEGADTISSMPDVILHHILSFVPIGLAIRTSVLSKRWKHVWCETPCLDFSPYVRTPTARDINQTLISYRALKITEFHLGKLELEDWLPESQLDSWIEFAMSRNVEKLSLIMSYCFDEENYRFPDCFYHSSSLENLTIDFDMIPRCAVSWKCLRTLILSHSFQPVAADVLSGCPVLETLALLSCGGTQCIDLSNSPSLTTLTIIRRKYYSIQGSMEIVAPHVRNLNLGNTDEPCTLVDVSSLALCRLGIALYLAQLRDVPFPTLKVQTVTLYTMFAISVIPGIVKLLQNSPGLKKLVVHVMDLECIQERDMERYLHSQGLNWDHCLRSKYEAFPSLKETLDTLAQEKTSPPPEMISSRKGTPQPLHLEHSNYEDFEKFIEETSCSNFNHDPEKSSVASDVKESSDPQSLPEHRDNPEDQTDLKDCSADSSAPNALILKFASSGSVPSAEKLNSIFNRYGPLTEAETRVMKKGKKARVVFKRDEDAETAFSSSGKYSIFGPSLLSYSLKYVCPKAKENNITQ
ncbi:hypothetical protein Bca52824_021857 [Brassica carinata]|uniref:RRM domain-containing protein n=1 Tax=Brassica carinata TaxID=52824 RepID=A0A8X8AQV1_BRACI|nr:hypothetical protein Bca52824_021857 [Brassica carinata]